MTYGPDVEDFRQQLDDIPYHTPTNNILDWINKHLKYTWHWENSQTPPEPKYMTADDWQLFKSRCVETYGGESVRSDGLTHREWLEYIRCGYRENSEFEDDWI